MHRPALQTITWGDPQHERFDAIFATAKAAGFAGLEIGFRRLGQVPAEVAAELLDKHGLTLTASHIGGNLADTGQASQERAELDRAIDYLDTLGVKYLMYSGLNEPDDHELDRQIDALNEAAKRCADRGVRLLYHNHNWEFLDNRRIFDRLLNVADPSLGFGPDLGWAAKAGADLTALLNELGDRIGLIHLKDYLEAERGGMSTVYFGQGLMDFQPVWDWLKTSKQQDLWVTAEQDTANDPDEAASHNGRFLIEHLSRIGEDS
ncbi:MAG: sugar phosphate isomerase/epimerase family protein [Planctomycetota bacterium]